MAIETEQLTFIAQAILRIEQALGEGTGLRGYLNLKAASIYLNVPQGTLREWARLRKIRWSRPGKELLFKISDLDAHLARHLFAQKKRRQGLRAVGGRR
jgi:excisionase family DNA binding protein